VIAGVLFHIAPFRSMQIHTFDESVSEAHWIAFVRCSHFVTESSDLEGLVAGIQEIALRNNAVHPAYLAFLVDPSIEATPLRIQVFVALHDSFPPLFFSDNSESFATLLPIGLLNERIEFRARFLQIMFAMPLTTEQICSIPQLPEIFRFVCLKWSTFWELFF
jgi:hypothetical protein